MRKSRRADAGGAVVENSASPLMSSVTLGQRAPTCRRTLAVSSGKVIRSAKQAAMPAPRNFTAVVGGTSEGFSPTMVPEAQSLQGPVEVQGERLLCGPGLQCMEEAARDRPGEGLAPVPSGPVPRLLSAPGGDL